MINGQEIRLFRRKFNEGCKEVAPIIVNGKFMLAFYHSDGPVFTLEQSGSESYETRYNERAFQAYLDQSKTEIASKKDLEVVLEKMGGLRN